MATARRAYTSEYRFDFAPEYQPERVRRTRERPTTEEKQKTVKKQEVLMTPANLRIMITAVVMIGLLLVAMVVVNAQAAKYQYAINQLRSENNVLENEVRLLNVEIEKSTGIEKLEKYATKNLKMVYPQGSQCIYISEVEDSGAGLADIIREKAYE